MELAHKTILLEELDFSLLYTTYKEHRRLCVFALKGLECVCCGIVGTRLIKSVDKAGNIHIDVYTDDYTLMTVDHTIPFSISKDNTLANKEPMCHPCNFVKDNSLLSYDELRKNCTRRKFYANV